MRTSQIIAGCCTLFGMSTGVSLLFLNFQWAAYGAGCWIIGYYLFLIAQENEYRQDEEQDQDQP